jgi:polyhydroxybutyrate depolymerase
MRLIRAKLTAIMMGLVTIPATAVAGQLEWNELSHDGGQRRYLLDLPTHADSAGTGLMIALHGFGSDARDIRSGAGFDQVRDRNDFTFVFPEGTGPAGGLSWNAGFCCRYAMEHNVDDLGFLDKLVDAVSMRSAVDARRIYVVGLSNGALLAYRWGAARAQRVAGIAAVAGAIGGAAGFFSPEVQIVTPSRPVSVLLFHSRDDPFFPYDGGVSLTLLQRLPGRSSISVAEAIQFWTTADGCASPPISSAPDRQGISVVSYIHCRDGTAVEAWTADHLGHDWPPGLIRLSGAHYRSLLAAYVIQFLRDHPKQDPVSVDGH